MSTVEVREVDEFWWQAFCHDCGASIGDPAQLVDEVEAEAAYHLNVCPSRGDA